MEYAELPPFTYSVSELDTVLVVTLVGQIRKSNKKVMRELTQKLVSTSAKAVILNLHELGDIEQTEIPDFTRLQMAVRKSRVELRLCSVKPRLESFLNELGVLRHDEVHEDLRAALVSLAHVE